MRMEMNGFDDVDAFLDKLGVQVRNASMKAVDEAAPILVRAAGEAVRRAANKGYATGELAGSFKATKAKNNQYGTYSVVRPEGYDDRRTSNYAKAVWLEYGTHPKDGRDNQASPWRQKAIDSAKSAVEDSLERSITRAVQEAGG